MSLSITRKLMNREAFMVLFMGGVGGLATLAVGIPIIGSALSPLINKEPDVWRDVGAVDSFKTGSTTHVTFQYNQGEPQQWAGTTQETAAWLRRDSVQQFTVFSVYCTHLGCPVYWLPTPRIFLCPCHGSVFYGDGTVAGGPAPLPLAHYEWRIRNGRLEIKTQAQPLVT